MERVTGHEGDRGARPGRENADVGGQDDGDRIHAIQGLRAAFHREPDRVVKANSTERTKKSVAMTRQPGITLASRERRSGDVAHRETQRGFRVSFGDDRGQPEAWNFNPPDRGSLREVGMGERRHDRSERTVSRVFSEVVPVKPLEEAGLRCGPGAPAQYREPESEQEALDSGGRRPRKKTGRDARAPARFDGNG